MDSLVGPGSLVSGPVLNSTQADDTSPAPFKPQDRPYLSFSRLSTFGGCPAKYRYRYIDHVPEIAQGALMGGSAIHEAIEHAEEHQLWATDEGMAKAADVFRQRFYEAVEGAGGPRACRWGGKATRDWPDKENHLWWMQNGPLLMLPNYARVRRADAEAGVLKVERAELEVLTPLPGVLASDGGPVMVKGYIDLSLVVTEDGEVLVRDWKTGISNAEPIQLAGYCWQLGVAGITQPTVGQFVYLRRSGAKMIQTHDVAPLVPIVPELYVGLEGLMRAAVAADCYPMQPSSFCVACTVRMSCPYGQTLGDPPEHWSTNPDAEEVTSGAAHGESEQDQAPGPESTLLAVPAS